METLHASQHPRQDTHMRAVLEELPSWKACGARKVSKSNQPIRIANPDPSAFVPGTFKDALLLLRDLGVDPATARGSLGDLYRQVHALVLQRVQQREAAATERREQEECVEREERARAEERAKAEERAAAQRVQTAARGTAGNSPQTQAQHSQQVGASQREPSLLDYLPTARFLAPRAPSQAHAPTQAQVRGAEWGALAPCESKPNIDMRAAAAPSSSPSMRGLPAQTSPSSLPAGTSPSPLPAQTSPSTLPAHAAAGPVDTIDMTSDTDSESDSLMVAANPGTDAQGAAARTTAPGEAATYPDGAALAAVGRKRSAECAGMLAAVPGAPPAGPGWQVTMTVLDNEVKPFEYVWLSHVIRDDFKSQREHGMDLSLLEPDLSICTQEGVRQDVEFQARLQRFMSLAGTLADVFGTPRPEHVVDLLGLPPFDALLRGGASALNSRGLIQPRAGLAKVCWGMKDTEFKAYAFTELDTRTPLRGVELTRVAFGYYSHTRPTEQTGSHFASLGFGIKAVRLMYRSDIFLAVARTAEEHPAGGARRLSP
eukprot:gene33972-43916_t